MRNALPDPEYDHAYYDGVPAKRFFAWVIDFIITTFITLLLGIITLSALLWIWPVVFVVVNFIYRSWTISSGSATLGMRLMNIELRNAMGQRFSGGEAMVHTLAFMVLFGFFIFQVLSMFMMATTARHQGLHDLIFGSVMLNRPR